MTRRRYLPTVPALFRRSGMDPHEKENAAQHAVASRRRAAKRKRKQRQHTARKG